MEITFTIYSLKVTVHTFERLPSSLDFKNPFSGVDSNGKWARSISRNVRLLHDRKTETPA
jgi:hypothetical protein